ncbi:hypothetical protein NQ317_002750 [Molorchus minor]|uniref:Peptidase aspartic putative domain-containing protein n=1 Tax=Molorchus minor TaxID=1323400 RepID=A0ABQ9J2L6_9CUCU|nr:hypothetical protein NQ317_002750 [Molorchus minor]
MSNQNLKDLTRKRGSIKARLTGFKNYIEGVIIDSQNTEKLDQGVILETESRLNRLENLLSEFHDIQSELEVIVESDSDYENQLIERDTFENAFYKVVSSFKCIIENNIDVENLSHKSKSSNATSVRGNNESLRHSNDLRSRPKLPAIPIPTFKGESENWLEFRDTFESIIHKNKSIADIEKFYFLKGALEGEAKKVVQLVDVSAANYMLAWEMLCERYDNKEMLVNEHIRSFLNLTSVSKESSSDLRQLLDILTKNLYGLKRLNIDIGSWDPILIYIFSEKLDKKTKLCWEEKRVDILGRFEKARGLGLCLNCLKKNHQSKDCKSIGCRKCGLKHHTLLHYEKQLSSSESQNGSESIGGLGNSATATNNSSTSANDIGSLVQVASLFTDSNQSEVLLSTALVQVLDKNGQLRTCRVLLDNGSQSNLITNEFSTKLGIGQQEINNVSISGINQVVSKIKTKCIIEFQSNHNGFKGSVSCLVVPQICDLVPSQNLNVKCLNIPSHIKLADPGYAKPGKIDLLLGAEIFYNLLCVGQLAFGKNQPTLQKTRLGWIVTGSMNTYGRDHVVKCNLSINTGTGVQTQLHKFCEVEELPTKKDLVSRGQAL